MLPDMSNTWPAIVLLHRRTRSERKDHQNTYPVTPDGCWKTLSRRDFLWPAFSSPEDDSNACGMCGRPETAPPTVGSVSWRNKLSSRPGSVYCNQVNGCCTFTVCSCNGMKKKKHITCWTKTQILFFFLWPAQTLHTRRNFEPTLNGTKSWKTLAKTHQRHPH